MNRSIETEIKCLDLLISEFLWLRVQRNKFGILFENENNRNEIYNSASQFFYEFNVMLIYDMNLIISKLTDPYDEKKQNLSLAYFLESNHIENKEEMNILYFEILNFRGKIIKARNKIISHNDLKTLLTQETYAQFEPGEDIKCIENIQKYLNIVSKELKGEIFGNISVGCMGDVNDLLKIIRYGNYVKEKWKNENEKEKVKEIILECLRN